MAVVGALLLVVGGIGAIFAQSVYATQASADCSAWPANCTITAQVTNTGLSAGTPFTSPFTAYFVYYNAINQVVLIDKVPWTSAATSVVDSGFTASTVPGASGGYSVNVFFVDATGRPMGPSLPQYATFGLPVAFNIAYIDVGSITVTPPGTSPSTHFTGTGSIYEAAWPAGTSVKVVTNGGYGTVQWSTGSFYSSTNGTPCPKDSSGTGYDCTLTVVGGQEVYISPNAASVSQAEILVLPQSSSQQAIGWTYNPTSLCLVQSPVGSCVTSGTITVSPIGGFSFPSGAQWQLGTVSPANGQFTAYTASGASGTIAAGEAAVTIPLSWALLQPIVNPAAGTVATVALQITAALSSVTLTIQQPAVSGVTLTPAPGTYDCSGSGSTVCQPGGTVQLSATVPAGYQFQDWIVNGQNVATTAQYTLQLPTSGPVAVAAYVAPSGTTPPPPPNPCSGSSCTGSNSTAAAIFYGLGVGGGVMLALGIVLPSGRKAR